MKKWLTKNKKMIVFVIYAVLTFSLLFVHRNWRDEAQAWLLGRDCSILELIHAMKYEGHMLLWNLILMPFAKLGLPYMTTNIISWVIMCVSVWLILDKAPFKFIYKVLLISFFPVWYLYPVVSRCYCLVPLAIVLMAIYYKDRKDKPERFLLSVVILANTHVIMFGMVGVVLLDFLLELIFDIKNEKTAVRNIKNNKKIAKKRKNIQESIKKREVWFGITVFLLILSVLPLLGCLSVNACVKRDIKFMQGLKCMLIDWPIALIKQVYVLNVVKKPYCTLGFLIVFSTLIIALVLEMKMYLSTYLRILVSVFYQLVIYSFIYYGSAQRGATIIFIVLYYKWIHSYKNVDTQDCKHVKIVKICYIILVVVSMINGLLYISNELNNKSSNAYEMGDYINNNLQQNSIILVPNRQEFVSAVIPYTRKDVKYYNITGRRYFTYTIWDFRNYITLTKSDIDNLKQIFNENDNLYYLHARYPVDKNEIDLINYFMEKKVFTGVYATKQNSYNNEDYVLYKVNLN